MLSFFRFNTHELEDTCQCVGSSKGGGSTQILSKVARKALRQVILSQGVRLPYISVWESGSVCGGCHLRPQRSRTTTPYLLPYT